MDNPLTCATCRWLITSEGEPYYCALRDLYTLRKPSSPACPDHQPLKPSSDPSATSVTPR